MELFIPSLVFLLAAIAVAFFVLPTIAPFMLIAGSAVVLAGALYLHYTRFGVMEYERATWQENLQKYANWVIFAAILLGAYGFYAMNQNSSALPAPLAEAVVSPAPAPLSMPVMSGGGIGTVYKTVVGRLGELMRRGRISTD
jgi:hypothetical protein